MVGGKVALSDNCCCSGCGSCTLPDCFCPHAISCEVKFDSNDNTESDFLSLYDDSDNGFGIYLHGGNLISLYSFPASEQIDVIVPNLYDTWHSVCATFCGGDDDDHVAVTLTVDGVSGSMTMTLPVTGWMSTRMYPGSRFVGDQSHRSFRCVSSFGNPNFGEPNFNFPPDSFDSFVGGASIVGGELRIDAVGIESYATIDTRYSMACVCPRDCTEISTITLTTDASADINCEEHSCGAAIDRCTLNCSGECTATFTRINHDVAFTAGVYQFKLWFSGSALDCQLNATFWDGTIESSNVLCDNVCEGVSCIQWNPGFENFCSTSPRTFTEGCHKTLHADLVFSINNTTKEIGLTYTYLAALVCECFSAPCHSEDALCCGFNTLNTDSTLGIPFTLSDVSGIKGVYTLSEHNTTVPANCSSYDTQASITVTIA